jgi:hypothetical protein
MFRRGHKNIPRRMEEKDRRKILKFRNVLSEYYERKITSDFVNKLTWHKKSQPSDRRNACAPTLDNRGSGLLRTTCT